MHQKALPWLILTIAALCVVFLGGKRRAFGIFVAELRAEFPNITLAELNWIGDSYAALGYLTTSLGTSSILATGRRFWASQSLGASSVLLACITSAYVPNPHWLFLTHTILHGIGSSLVLSTAGLVVNEHFDKNHRYHILATTLVSGGSVASIVFVEFYAYLVEHWGWRFSFVILGIIYFLVLFIGTFVFVKNPNKADYRSDRCVLISRDQLSCKRSALLVLWFIDRIMTSVVTYGMLLNLVDYMYRHETSLQRSALLTTLFAAGEASTYLIGAVATAITKDLLKNRLKYILLITSFILFITLTIWELEANSSRFSHFLAYISGFCLGPSITFLFPAGEEMTMLPGHMAYPFSLGGMGVGMVLSPILSAIIAQTFQYRWFFLVQGFMMLIKFFALLCATLILHNLTSRGQGYVPATFEEIPTSSSVLYPDDSRSESSDSDEEPTTNNQNKPRSVLSSEEAEPYTLGSRIGKQYLTQQLT
ncbi:Monocarboxylate transporter 5 [Fasciola gigantica]|uniref:Monocarboxylate transporter 5 n=1 Tax=Fasciola gigantica TaxID=46835 RepID=A0A504YQI9_FASGI|nr:Monocarboxylate transporter 5 [Fasciola gigantica]